MKNIAPLLCDTETGVCELSLSPSTTRNETIAWERNQKPIQVIYFTDPICSACWGIEPQLRKLKLEYGGYFEIDYRMGGLLPSWQGFNSGGIAKPEDVAAHWDEVGRYYQIPIDGNIWLEDPLESSYPPSIAFIAAKMQDPAKAIKFLRRIREMVFIEKKNIAKWEHQIEGAIETGLDASTFKTDFEGRAIELFYADLDLAKTMGVRSFPTLLFMKGNEIQKTIKGVKSYEHFEQTIHDLHPGAEKSFTSNHARDIFSYFPTLATKEFAVITNRTFEASEKILQALADNGTLLKISTKNGAFWKINAGK